MMMTPDNSINLQVTNHTLNICFGSDSEVPEHILHTRRICIDIFPCAKVKEDPESLVLDQESVIGTHKLIMALYRRFYDE